MEVEVDAKSVWRRHDTEVLLKAFNHRLDTEDHSDRNVLTVAARSLIDGYVEGEVWICADFFTPYILLDLELRDLAVVFQDRPAVDVAEF